MEPRPVNRWLVTASVMIPTLIEVLDTSVANVALNHIQGSLAAGQEEVTWVLTSYLVANAVIIPLSGWLARTLGRKRYLMASLILFTVSSLLCGAATSLGMLIFFRVIQGVGGGGLQPMSQAILMETFPPHKRGMAMAIYAMGVVLGPILGPLVGGYLTDNYSWRWIFYVNLPIGLLALFMNYTFVFDPSYMERRQIGEKVDYIGLALLCVGLGCLQIVLDKGQIEDWFNSDFILGLSVISGLALGLMIWWELRQSQPILDLRIFKNRSFATGCAVMALGFFAFFGSIVLLPLFLQNMMGYDALLAGLVLGPSGAVTILMLPLIGRLTERIDSRLLLACGLLINAGAVYYMAGFNLSIDFLTAATGRMMQGVGMPFFFVSLSYVTMVYVDRPQMNNASALFNLLRNLGGSFGVAFVTTVLTRRAQFHQSRLIEHLSNFDLGYTMRLRELKAALAGQLGAFTDQTQAAGAFIYGQMIRQATAMAFNDTFFLQTMLFLGMTGLVWIIRKPPIGRRGGPPREVEAAH